MAVPLVPIAVAGVASAGVLALAFSTKAKRDKAAILQSCDDVRTRLEAASRAGQDPHAQELLRIEYAACLRRAVANGVPVDPALYLLPCNLVRDYLNASWVDYKATSYTDPVARDNKRNNIISQGGQMITCLSGQLDAATTGAQVRAILTGASGAVVDSIERAQCMRQGSPGCGRFAVNEEAGDVRGWKELEAVGIPGGASLADVSVFFHNHPERETAFYRIAGISKYVANDTIWTDRQGRRRVTPDPNTPDPAMVYGGLRARGEAKLRVVEPVPLRGLDAAKLRNAVLGLGPIRLNPVGVAA